MASIPGAPNLLSNAPKAIGLTLLGNIVSKLWDFLFPGPEWGVFVAGETFRAVEVSSVQAMDIRAGSRVMTFPIQSGSFISYNKVLMPGQIGIRMTKEGDDLERSTLISWLQVNKEVTSTFDILMPEFRFRNYTLIDYQINRRSDTGVALIIADCIFQEVRELPAEYSNSNISDPENMEPTPTARVNPQENTAESAGGEVQWQ